MRLVLCLLMLAVCIVVLETTALKSSSVGVQETATEEVVTKESQAKDSVVNEAAADTPSPTQAPSVSVDGEEGRSIRCNANPEVGNGDGTLQVATECLGTPESPQQSATTGRQVQDPHAATSLVESQAAGLSGGNGGLKDLSTDSSTGPKGMAPGLDSALSVDPQQDMKQSVKEHSSAKDGDVAHSEGTGSASHKSATARQDSAGITHPPTDAEQEETLLHAPLPVKAGGDSGFSKGAPGTQHPKKHAKALEEAPVPLHTNADQRSSTSVPETTEIVLDDTKTSLPPQDAKRTVDSITTTETDMATEVPSTANAKVTFTPPKTILSTLSTPLPLHHSVDKTDFSLGSSSLFALAALATLAVAAAAPAH